MMMSTGTNMATLEFVVDDDRCYGCGACIGLCPTNALSMKELLAIVEQELCTYCEHCIPSCPVDALEILSR
ncbi:MAG: ferredoxin [Euryarchaeota archaeon]|jgi:Fe-S-cluster-containing hydrogenase component 2|nr:ferredoxin [Euryarchaeota archaeon]RPG78024.1 MAG: 4Fe-4S dicluster domain-containing protein [Euryarchaeota archaeon TMED117]|tara:strand:+ start:866 stop:1078 length:213 start_codon:yes stop_codon:yes gene_type:complete